MWKDPKYLKSWVISMMIKLWLIYVMGIDLTIIITL